MFLFFLLLFDYVILFFFSSRRRHTRFDCDWSSDVCSSDLDLLARYKINAFHIHLTDDEGWRIELPSLPELTALGARRGHPPDSGMHLPPAFGSGPTVDRP